ncbi:MAG: hypothetical protein ACFB0B_01035 [Thermonemataceae bacterium]
MRVLYFILYTAALYACQSQKTIKIDEQAYAKVVYERLKKEVRIHPTDTFFIRKFYQGDTSKFLEYQYDFLKNAPQKYSWKALSWTIRYSEMEAQVLASQMGFSNAYYFIKYLRDSSQTQPLKEEIIMHARVEAFKIAQNSAVFSMSVNELFHYNHKHKFNIWHHEQHKRPKRQREEKSKP